MSDMDDLRITPEPTDAEAAAIVAAITVVTETAAQPADTPTVPRWRFSGRWWSAPVSARRARP
ncbi:MAG: hypothetical protein M5U19_02275 [Microthrixaceae bacterium]|nr:hypothetical protein [Microthrixaceae bacterium]